MFTEEFDLSSRVHSTLPPGPGASDYDATPIISREMFLRIGDVVILLATLVGCLGIVTNLWNILVFKKMGLKDSVSLCLFIQSIVDLLYVITSVGFDTSALLVSLISVLNIFPNTVLTREPISAVAAHYKFALYDMSIFTTVYITVQRCCCVALPLHFNLFFTTRKNCIIIFILAVYTVVSNVPNVMLQRLSVTTIPGTNISALQIIFFPEVEKISSNTLFVNQMILSTCSYFIVCICFVILAVSLRRSAKFRQTVAKSSDKNSKKEMTTQVLRTVLFMSVVFLVTNLHRAVLSFLFKAIDSFSRGNYLFPLLLLSVDFSFLLECLNASLNFFVYYQCNTKFRKVYKSTPIFSFVTQRKQPAK